MVLTFFAITSKCGSIIPWSPTVRAMSILLDVTSLPHITQWCHDKAHCAPLFGRPSKLWPPLVLLLLLTKICGVCSCFKISHYCRKAAKLTRRICSKSAEDSPFWHQDYCDPYTSKLFNLSLNTAYKRRGNHLFFCFSISVCLVSSPSFLIYRVNLIFLGEDANNIRSSFLRSSNMLRFQLFHFQWIKKFKCGAVKITASHERKASPLRCAVAPLLIYAYCHFLSSSFLPQQSLDFPSERLQTFEFKSSQNILVINAQTALNHVKKL